MNISTLSPIKALPRPEEVSNLRSPRDSSTVYNAWKREYEIVKNYNQLAQTVNQLTREMKKLRGRQKLGLDLFPFCIYNPPSDFQPNPPSGSNWNLANIRGGYVFTSTFDTGSTWVHGTDRKEANAYLNIFPSDITMGQYIVPTGSANYWFWVEKSGSAMSGSPYFVRYSATPQTPDSTGNPNGWNNWPLPVRTYYMIGYADTQTSGAYNIMLFRQIQVGDILATAPPSFTASLCRTETGLPETWTLYGYPSSSLG